jgi:hypothetical protein
MFTRTLVSALWERLISTPCLRIWNDRAQPGLRAWAVLGELRAILTGAGQELPKAAEKSFVKEGEILERGLRKALTERDEAIRDLAAARWVDRSAFGKEEGFGQAHQAVLKALDKASAFV